MSVRVRFAPSPTGHVHIGNIRTAIFNYLFARHEGGRFLLRIEDTDRERSTAAAIATLQSVMQWLDMADYDEEPLYQSRQADEHRAAAERLIAAGHAYRHAKGEGGEATLLRFPWNAPELPFVRRGETVELELHPESPLRIDHTGVSYATVSKKGKPTEDGGALAGFRDLTAIGADGAVLFELEPAIGEVLSGARVVSLNGVARLRFTRHLAVYADIVKGELTKPLDSLKDQVIVRSDGNPVFHLANVVDDITQGITHIIRGDDHVENTYRHLFLFHALGATPPRYAHLPMIVNDAGKPYSKRDGDAYVSDFQEKGILPDALFNYLSLLGWSPGDDREMLSRAELVATFTLDRVRSAPSQMDLRKLEHVNALYIGAMPLGSFIETAKAAIADTDWGPAAAATYRFHQVASLMQSRAKTLLAAQEWDYFFTTGVAIDMTVKAIRKGLQKEGAGAFLRDLRSRFAATHAWNEATIEATIHQATAAAGLGEGSMNLPIRIAVTGTNVGAGLYETLVLLDRDEVLNRLGAAAELSETWSTE